MQRKSIAAVRLLRVLYDEIAVHPVTDAQVDAAARQVHIQCGEVLSAHAVRHHFNSRWYRERRKHGQTYEPYDVPVLPRVKSDYDIERLRDLWDEHDGQCPTRNSAAVRKLLTETDMSYGDVAQWFGQQRYRSKVRTRWVMPLCVGGYWIM